MFSTIRIILAEMALIVRAERCGFEVFVLAQQDLRETQFALGAMVSTPDLQRRNYCQEAHVALMCILLNQRLA